MGLPMYLEFEGDRVTTNALGIPLAGTYTINNNRLTLTFIFLGHSQDFHAELRNGKIYFKDAVLEKKR